MKNEYLILTMICLISSLSSCIPSEKLKPLSVDSKFDAIMVFNNIELTMNPGKHVSYQVSGPKYAKSKLMIGIEGDCLIIKVDGLRGSDKLSINLTAPMLKSIETFNGASFALNESADIEDLELRAWNSSKIEINKNIIAKKVSVSSFNSGHIVIKSVIADKLRIEAANNAVVYVSGKVKNITKSVLNDATVDTNGLSDCQSQHTYNDDSDDTVIVYSNDISLFGRIFD